MTIIKNSRNYEVMTGAELIQLIERHGKELPVIIFNESPGGGRELVDTVKSELNCGQRVLKLSTFTA